MHEDLLRHIWARQLFRSVHLTATDGRPVRIISPGTLHRGSGPDFRNAKISVGETLLAGDIEFHRSPDDWELHNHHLDPQYNSVILHVVLSGSAESASSHSGRAIPTIVLEPFLLSPIETLRDQLAREEYSSRSNTIRCSGKNSSIDPALLTDWIRTLYKERLQEKITHLHDQLCDIILRQQRTIGEPHSPYNEMLDPDEIPLPDTKFDALFFRQRLPWEQLLYEQLMDGLGYSNNRAPMMQLANSVSLISLIAQSPGNFRAEYSVSQIEAMLFHAARLLPSISDVDDQESRIHIHSLRTALKEIGEIQPSPGVRNTDWIFSPTRPSNFPTIRIAAASVLLQRILYGSMFKSLITLIGGKYSSAGSKIEQLRLLLDPGEHNFWNYHYSFTEATHQKHAILGESRKNDIIVNVVIPFVCLYAKIFGKEDLTERCLAIAVEMSPLEENTILRTMQKHLTAEKVRIEHAYQQQGLIQLYKKYCMADRCSECAVGKRVFREI
jgi:hypothetical protein